jgi:hypothetical protein
MNHVCDELKHSLMADLTSRTCRSAASFTPFQRQLGDCLRARLRCNVHTRYEEIVARSVASPAAVPAASSAPHSFTVSSQALCVERVQSARDCCDPPPASMAPPVAYFNLLEDGLVQEVIRCMDGPSYDSWQPLSTTCRRLCTLVGAWVGAGSSFMYSVNCAAWSLCSKLPCVLMQVGRCIARQRSYRLLVCMCAPTNPCCRCGQLAQSSCPTHWPLGPAAR